MLVFVDASEVNRETEVGNVVREPGAAGRDGRVGEVGVDDDDGQDAKNDVIAEGAETGECVLWPDNTGGGAREEEEVLLHHCLVRVFGGPIILGRSLWVFRGRGDVSAWDPLMLLVSSGLAEATKMYRTGFL